MDWMAKDDLMIGTILAAYQDASGVEVLHPGGDLSQPPALDPSDERFPAAYIRYVIDDDDVEERLGQVTAPTRTTRVSLLIYVQPSDGAGRAWEIRSDLAAAFLATNGDGIQVMPPRRVGIDPEGDFNGWGLEITVVIQGN